jgi:hypothetical protein
MLPSVYRDLLLALRQIYYRLICTIHFQTWFRRNATEMGALETRLPFGDSFSYELFPGFVRRCPSDECSHILSSDYKYMQVLF